MYLLMLIFLSFSLFFYQMAAFNIQEALIWKEKIELVIDQVQYLTHSGNPCLLRVKSDILHSQKKKRCSGLLLNIYLSLAASGVTGR